MPRRSGLNPLHLDLGPSRSGHARIHRGQAPVPGAQAQPSIYGPRAWPQGTQARAQESQAQNSGTHA